VKLLYLALLWFCFQALLPSHCPENSGRAQPIVPAPRVLWEMRHQGILQLHDTDGGDRSESHAIKQFDHDEEFGQSSSSVRQDAVPGRPRTISLLEELSEMFLQTLYPVRDVADSYPFDGRGTRERFDRMHEAFVGDGHPKEEVRQRDRVGTPLERFLGARSSPRSLDGSGLLPIRDLDLFPHPAGNLRMESERSPDESLKSSFEDSKHSGGREPVSSPRQR
jgi:hypothetical protein